jgi:hypothetical protein
MDSIALLRLRVNVERIERLQHELAVNHEALSRLPPRFWITGLDRGWATCLLGAHGCKLKHLDAAG